MKKIALAVFLFFGGVCLAQQSLWIDLSGEWRVIYEDADQFAAMDFDDSAWRTVSLPFGATMGRQRLSGSTWLRRRIALPAGADPAQLTLTLGTLHDIYELYVNGRRIAASGDPQSLSRVQLARPRSWRIPPGIVSAGGPVQIALHVRRVTFGGPMWRIEDKGPYLLTYEHQAPIDAGRSQLDQAAVQNSPSVILGAIFLVLGMLGLAGWAGERSRTELLWFSMATLVRAVGGVYTWNNLSATALPFNDVGTPVFLVVPLALTYTLFGEFVLAALALNRPWPRLLLWLCFALTLGTVFLGRDYRWSLYYGHLGASCVALSAVLWNWWRTRGTRVGFENHLFRFVLLLWALTAADHWLRLAIREYLFRSIIHSQLTENSQWLRLADGIVPEISLWIHGYRVFREDLFWLVISAAIFAMLIRRLALDRREQRRLANELEAARAVQQLLLKQPVLHQPDLAIDAVYIPAQEVGGDFYYVLDGELVLVGDVSGKGLKAAMLVALVIGLLRRDPAERRPAKVLEALNHALEGQVEGGFITCCCIRFGPEGSIRIANAGHPVPYIDGREAVLAPGLPLGITRDATYDEAELTLAPGSAVTLISDGVPEAANAQRELLGFERTREMSTQEPSSLAEAARRWGQTDDITVVAVRRSA